jgi:hypothetical protein
LAGDIYRKYYGLKVSAFILGTFYISMELAALAIEVLFQVAGLVPAERRAQIVEATTAWSRTSSNFL